MRQPLTESVALEMKKKKEAGDSFASLSREYGYTYEPIYRWLKKVGWE
jgi:hypothetical protein